MNSEAWQLVKELFEASLELEPAERSAFLAKSCTGDQAIRQEVESLLAAHEGDPTFMNTPVGNLLVVQKPMLVAGQSFGHYEAISLLGEGGMGQVYLAVDERLGRKVALKLLPSSYTHDADRLRRFDQEARAASALNHPNIVTIHEIGEIDSLHFIATEFVDGETLRKQIKTTRSTVGEVLDVAAQVASALQAAHEAGIVHRDIKPENIMLRHDRVVKVLDFGIAKLLANREDGATERSDEETSTIITTARFPVSPSNTSPGVVMGTVGYMSPEQARGQEVDARTDLWSLGVVLYEMVARRAPFEGETPSQVIASILESKPSALSLDSELAAELSRIVTKALCKDQRDRYQTAGDMALDLKNLKEDLTVESRLKQFRKSDSNGEDVLPRTTQTFPESPTRTVHGSTRRTTGVNYFVGEIKRHKILVTAAIAAFLIVVIGLTYSLINRNRTELVQRNKKSIAVLPLKPINASDRNTFYEIGIADSVILRLSSMKGVEVRHLSATGEYRDNEQDPIAVGKEQRVDYVLAATYHLVDGKIRVTARLFNVATGQVDRTFQIEKDTSHLLAMQDEIAAEVENILQTQFATTSSPAIAKRGTTNEEAYLLYLHGMYLANNRNSIDAQKAVTALEQSVALDPNYARAWAGLAYAQRALGLRTGDAHKAHQKSIEAITRALALDPNLSEGHSALCENKYLYEWDFAGAEQACLRAIQLDPSSSQAHEIFSRYLMGRGRHDEAIAEIKTAIDLDPASRFVQRNYGRALFYARRYPEAAAQLERVVEMDQTWVGTYSWVTSAWALQGNESRAFELFNKLLITQKVDQETVQVFKKAFETSGWRGVLSEWVKRFETIGGNNFDGALYNAQIGNKDAAFEYLDKVYQQHEIWLTYLQVEPRLDPLRDDPRFVELVRRVESK